MNAYNPISLKNALFLDIEAVREFKTFNEFIEHKNIDNWKKVAAKYYRDVLKHDQTPSDMEIYEGKAGLHAEYAKIVCIGFGDAISEIQNDKETLKKRTYDITSHDEIFILKTFADQLNKAYEKNPETILCGHNILEYDIPFIVKRMIKYKIHIPQILKSSIYGKPWEIKIIDTMRDWRMNTSHYMSMDTICEFMGIPSSKHGEVNGSTLSEYYWSNQDKWNTADEKNVPILCAIKKYCKEDIVNVREIFIYLAKV